MRIANIASAILAGLISMPVFAAEPEPVKGTHVPVIWRMPMCKHEKLGAVSIKQGREVSAATTDMWIPSADYRVAFERLAAAGEERGANAVVLRWHEATFFTRGGRRTTRPVFVQLKGAAIRLPDDVSTCDIEAVDPADVQARALRGEPVEMPPDLVAPSAASR